MRSPGQSQIRWKCGLKRRRVPRYIQYPKNASTARTSSASRNASRPLTMQGISSCCRHFSIRSSPRWGTAEYCDLGKGMRLLCAAQRCASKHVHAAGSDARSLWPQIPPRKNGSFAHTRRTGPAVGWLASNCRTPPGFFCITALDAARSPVQNGNFQPSGWSAPRGNCCCKRSKQRPLAPRNP